MSEVKHFSSALLNVATGSSIERKSWPVLRSDGPQASNLQYKRNTTDRKTLSGYRNGHRLLQPVYQSPGSLSLCVPSPLENLPLVGKRINIGRKNGSGDLWRPSEAAPQNIIYSYAKKQQVPGIRNPNTRFGQKPWCELRGLPEPAAPLPSLVDSAEFDEIRKNCTTGSNTQQQIKFLPPLTRKQRETNIYHPEPGSRHVPFHNNNKTDTGSMYSVSAHKPVRARQSNQAPLLSFFHCFQTEVVFDDSVSGLHDTQINEMTEIKQKLSEDFLSYHSGKNSPENDAFCSNLSTAASTMSPRKFLWDTCEDQPSKKGNHSSHLDLKYDSSYVENQREKSARCKRNSSRCTEAIMYNSKCDDASHEQEKGCVLENDGGPLNLKNLTEISSNKQIKWKVLEIDSEEFKEGCAFYEANLLMKNAAVPKKLTKLPQTTYTFSKTSGQLLSGDRKRVIERLTKLPLRFLRNQKSLQTTDNSVNNDNMSTSSSHFNTFFTSTKNATLSTVNLQLDIIAKQRKLPIPKQHRNRILFQTNLPVGGGNAHVTTTVGPRPFYNATDTVCPLARHGNFTKIACPWNSQLCEALFEDMCIHGASPRFFLPETSAFESVLEQIKVNDVDGNKDDASGTGTAEHSTVSKINESVIQSVSLSDSTVMDSVTQDLSSVKENFQQVEIPSNSQMNEVNEPNYPASNQTCLVVNKSNETSQHTIQNVPDPQRNEAYNCESEESLQTLPTEPMSKKDCSIMSVDGVPNNSPADSPRCYSTTRRHADFTNRSAESCVKLPHETCNELCEDDVHLSMLRDFGQQVPQCAPHSLQESLISGRELDNLELRSPIVSHDQVIKKTDCLQSDRSEEQQKEEEDCNASTWSRDLSPHSHDSTLSDSDESLCSSQQFLRRKVDTDSEESVINNTPDEYFSVEEEEVCMKKVHMLIPTVRGVTDDNPGWETCSCDKYCPCELSTREDFKSSACVEPAVTACKNVRFSDVDKIISFRNDDTGYDNTFSETYYASRQSEMRTNYSQPISSDLVLHKLTLQPPTCSNACGCAQAFKRPHFVNPLIRSGHMTAGPVKSNHLQFAKWNACNYKASKPEIGEQWFNHSLSCISSDHL